jgi:hypothetical protein
MSATRKGRPPHPNFRAAAAEAARRPKSESFKQQTARRMRREWHKGLRHGHPRGRLGIGPLADDADDLDDGLQIFPALFLSRPNPKHWAGSLSTRRAGCAAGIGGENGPPQSWNLIVRIVQIVH